MQMYQAVQKSFHSIGLSPKLEAFNQRALCFVAITFLIIISEWIFLVYEADSAEEYMASIYAINTCAGVLLSFTSTIFTKKRLFSFMTMHNAYFDTSK